MVGVETTVGDSPSVEPPEGGVVGSGVGSGVTEGTEASPSAPMTGVGVGEGVAAPGQGVQVEQSPQPRQIWPSPKSVVVCLLSGVGWCVCREGQKGGREECKERENRGGGRG